MRKKITSILLGLTLSASMVSTSWAATTYTVNSGDVLWKIADRYSLTVNELKDLNNLTSDEIYPGQTLVVSKDSDQYVVQANDTLWIISQKLDISIQALIDANPQLSNPNNLRIGQVIYLPNTNNSSGNYIVQANDTLWIISQKLGISIQDLINANPQLSNPNNLMIGQSIQIPGSSSNPSNPIETPGEQDIFADGMFPLKAGTYEPYVNSYGDGRDYNTGGSGTRSHDGVDIMADKGTPIYSALDGKVINYGWNEYGGWRLTVQVDDSTVFYYAHMSGYAEGMEMGTEVKKGQIIGYVGSTGYGPVGTSGNFENHLHFGIYKLPNWNTIDPYPYLKNWE
ncbi:LysM peptidoglycan-binding domain-containing M23 family metallopeptidase [Chengkuizengella axinellae]|uniref:LysM peptidoglycan-binding domain-containing M23 family metallopeptidase n=1 Tax=Chengkuizengella axinellae TaxID=3064388 RepID=A0ABT9J0Z6_9BACL|nr:LysM peptidoglycan-binding domain-containing M23 family metallopeptidase [Chengkuizengella sp. 2205SS18-9]MDP5275289.1 LysM peptidoglycan-binding domain-containing M23 family metallopeptidase [Chengkuizengella sp. 2205SS18-9]